MSLTGDLTQHVLDKARAAKAASTALAGMDAHEKNAALRAMAAAVEERAQSIFAANAEDLERARAGGLSPAKIDRLTVSESRLSEVAAGLREVCALDDPVGVLLGAFTRPNGLVIEKRTVPMGVIAIIYESRPNVTVDAAALALKAGSAVVLRGGREALATNRAFVSALREGLAASAVPAEAIELIERTEHETVDILLGARGLVDLAIPRGGAGLIARVVEGARIPVIETGIGNCHVYVDAAADPKKASAIVLNAKVQRCSVCNAMETLLVHEEKASDWLRSALAELHAAGVTVRGCPRVLAAAAGTDLAGIVEPASEEDWGTEYLDLILAVKVVASVKEAMAHIARYGTGHSEAIVTEDRAAAEVFLQGVDAACVYHNASTRFTDGFAFGFGAEMGISTQKLHARGPMGLAELTSYKYIVRGSGQVR